MHCFHLHWCYFCKFGFPQTSYLVVQIICVLIFLFSDRRRYNHRFWGSLLLGGSKNQWFGICRPPCCHYSHRFPILINCLTRMHWYCITKCFHVKAGNTLLLNPDFLLKPVCIIYRHSLEC